MKNLALLIFILPLAVFAQKAKNYSTVTGELTTKIIATAPSGKSLHVAVVPFAATSSSVEKSAAFGDYLTETIIGSLTGQPDKIKVFERTRLDAVLKEQEFILTDLMKPSAALKIGQLVPIDALLSGTYTKLKSYIDVNARLIDVATGEISVSFNGRIKMNKNLATLFKQQGADDKYPVASPKNEKEDNNNVISLTTSDSKTKAALCKQKAEEFSNRLHDLTTPEKIQAVVTEAKKTPFDNTCGQLHFNMMYSFTRYKIDNNEYKTFVLRTLDTIAFPSGDERALEIARFLAADGTVDDTEWTTSLRAMSKIGNYSLSFFSSTLLAKPASPAQSVVESRIASYFALASAGKIGLPRPITYDAAFFSMLDAMKGNQPLRQHVYATYASKLTADDRSKATLFSALHSMYKEETTHKTDIMKWIVEFINSNEYPKAPEQLYDLARDFKQLDYPGRTEEVKKSFPDADLKQLVTGCSEKFSKYALLSPYESQKEDRITFCVINGIPIAGVIPTTEEADAILKGNNASEQQRITKMLSLMEEPPRKLESSLVTLLSKRSLDDKEKLVAAQTNAIIILGNIKTSNPKAVEYMIGVLPHYGNDTEAAEQALVEIGKPAVPALVAKLDKTTFNDGGLQHQLITILGKIGKDAAMAEKSITRVLNSTTNSDIKYAAEAALQVIRN
ncbi:MAG TPA: FlgO family outer membrane protein [Cyclobacteriaceae bacterium]|nr:FlgO family outer membrane protein [Cyclobacteriaceae bacterium]